jgi:hypothetical protein
MGGNVRATVPTHAKTMSSPLARETILESIDGLNSERT